jgi:hypothetical protein
MHALDSRPGRRPTQALLARIGNDISPARPTSLVAAVVIVVTAQATSMTHVRAALVEARLSA